MTIGVQIALSAAASALGWASVAFGLTAWPAWLMVGASVFATLGLLALLAVDWAFARDRRDRRVRTIILQLGE